MSNLADQSVGNPAGQRGRIATAIAASVDMVPGIQRSKSLMRSTLYPGGRIDGVVLSAQLVTVHILIDPSRYGDDLRRIGGSAARAAEEALHALGDERPVAVRIDDFLPAPSPEPSAVG